MILLERQRARQGDAGEQTSKEETLSPSADASAHHSSVAASRGAGSGKRRRFRPIELCLDDCQVTAHSQYLWVTSSRGAEPHTGGTGIEDINWEVIDDLRGKGTIRTCKGAARRGQPANEFELRAERLKKDYRSCIASQRSGRQVRIVTRRVRAGHEL